jgi:site-specific DNA recombinase
VQAGRWPGGPAPFGFRIVDNPDGPGRALEVHPPESAFIREATERVLAGASLLSVVRWANGPAGIRPRRAPQWSRRTLMQVLTGYPVQGRLMRLLDGRYVPVVDGMGDPLSIPEILTPDESAAVRQKLAPTPDSRKGGRRPSRLLSGILRCHSCDGRMQVARRTDGSVTYRCQTSSEAGVCDQPVSVSATALEDFIGHHFLSAWGDSPEYVKRAQVTGAAEVEHAEEAVTAALNALAVGATPERFQALQAAQAARDDARDMPQEAQVLIVPTGRTVAEAWEAGDTESRRDLISTSYAEIIVGPGRRGPRGIDPSRLTIITQPPFPVGHVYEGFRRGAMVVTA